MQRKLDKLTIIRVVGAGIVIALSGVLFVISIEALNQFIKVRSHMVAAAGTFGLVVLGIVELSYLIYAGEAFRRPKTLNAVVVRLARHIGGLGLLFALVQVFELWTYIPNPANWAETVGAVWIAGDVIYLVAGTVVFVGSIVIASVFKRAASNRKPQKHSASVGPDGN